MAYDPVVASHKEWLGYVQPTGLVVSIPALMDAGAIINRNFTPLHRRLLDAVPKDAKDNPAPEYASFPAFVHAVFDWPLDNLYGAPGAPAVPSSLECHLEGFEETLRPTYALREFEPKDGQEWILLIQEVPRGTDLDATPHQDGKHWQASPQARFEYLLHNTGVPAGLLVNGTEIRLVYAPRLESSGYAAFKLSEMVQVQGRPIFTALHMLLEAPRLFSAPEKDRLPALLANSRKFQNLVSTQLAGQVLEALYELLRGFQAADDQVKGELLRDVLRSDPNKVYAGLLTTLMRIVFLFYAEDRNGLCLRQLLLGQWPLPAPPRR